MMAIAGTKSGHQFMFLSDAADSCAAPYGELLCAPLDDTQAQDRLAQFADVVTYEFENIPCSVVQRIESAVPLHPSSLALSIASDRLQEKSLFRQLGMGTTDFFPVDSLELLTEAFSAFGAGQAAILKTRTQGYDGKGQAVINQPAQIADAWQQVGQVPCILEAKVKFSREVSMIAARSPSGEMVFYPLSENVHREGILRLSIARVDDPLQQQAEAMARRLMEHLDYVGVLALELFHVGDELFVNEIAPRVHNSGHWTIEGAATSQFDNHLRAVCGLPLGDTAVSQSVAMVNLIGTVPSEKAIAEIANATLHVYGKTDRPGRKVGHITLVDDSKTGSDVFVENLITLLDMVGEKELASALPFVATNS